MPRLRVALPLLGILCLFWSSGVSAAGNPALSLTPVQDVTLTLNGDRIPDETLGVSTRGRYTRRTLLKFDLAPLHSPVRSATLRLVPSGVIGDPAGTVSIGLWALDARQSSDWDENSVSWSTAPTTVTGFAPGTTPKGLVFLATARFDTQADLTKRVPMRWSGRELTACLETARRAGVKSITFVLVSEEPNDAPGVYFFSKDFVTAWARAYVPRLEIK